MRDVSLASLQQRIAEDPEASLERTVGPAESPRLLVVSMTDSAVDRYRREFGNDFMFEENAPLKPLGAGLDRGPGLQDPIEEV
jgi:hypothetical protein